MSFLVEFPVPSCSGSGIRKRRNGSDSDSSGIKRPRYLFVLESESDVPSSEEGSESIWSLQNRSTDFAKSTSDTSSKSSHNGSDFDAEYEVVSLSEKEVNVPFDGYSSGTNMTWNKIPLGENHSDSSLRSRWADNSSASEDAPSRKMIAAPIRSCLKCKAPTRVQFCLKCYKVRKDFFPPRPKLNKRKKSMRPFFKKKCFKTPQGPSKDEKVESGIESGSSQEIMLTPEEKSDSPIVTEGLCNICFKNPKDGAFVHCRWVHIFSCYECSNKIWFSSMVCPLCNGKINKVMKVSIG